MEFVPTLLVILVAALIAGMLAHRLGQPVILGFVVAGVALGPYTGGITVTELIDAQLLSQVGVALLLFALGVEFSLATLRPHFSLAFLGVPTQFILTLLYGYAIGQLLGWQPVASFWFAALIALSSPIVALHTLGHFQLGEALAARFARSILVVQNLLVVSLLFVMRQLQIGNTDLPTLALATVEGIAFLGILLFLGIYILPRLYAYSARQESTEIPLLVVAGSAAVVIYGTYLYGLTFVEVAFIMGLLLSESELGARALNVLKSMRDLFGALFFVSAGMLLNLAFLSTNIGLVLGLLGLVTVGKMLILGGTMRLFGYESSDSLIVALTLFPMSELSFVFARIALDSSVIDDELHSLFIAVGLITMLLTPFVVRMALRLRPQIRERSLFSSNI